jgi:hypothetical protein
MYVVSGTEAFGPSEKTTLAHEFTHALQDQYFDLQSIESEVENNGDQSLAVQALIEGDATLTMVLYARQYLSLDELVTLQTSGQVGTLDRAPLVVRDELSFPYNEGSLFAFSLFLDGGFEAVNQAFQDPPRSTEQILHPEKYLARERPVEVQLPDLAAALGAGWTELRTDVLGELDMRILLRQFGSESAALAGSAGWGGDRFSLLEGPSGKLALVMGTTWDDQSEASEFFNEFAKGVRGRYGNRARRVQEAASTVLWSTPNGPLHLQQSGAQINVVYAPDDVTLQPLLAALGGAPAPATRTAPSPAPVQLPR